jgi:hypothetical protein
MPAHSEVAALLLCCSAALSCSAQPQPASKPAPQPTHSTSLTIYSSALPGAIPPEMYRPLPASMNGGYNPYQGQPIPGYAVVRQERTLPIARGRSQIRFADVAALIDPTTVTFTDLTDPDGTHILEQNYQFDLVGQAKLLERYIDRVISVQQYAGDKGMETVTGTLLSATGGNIILRRDHGDLWSSASYYNVMFPALPEGLITRPTLVWDVESAQAGDHRARVSYQTTGMTWWADYNILFADGKDANSGTLDLGAWVSIINQSGASYPDSALKLIAGDVQRITPQGVVYPAAAMDERLGTRGGAPGFEEKAFFEYHLYTLGRPTTLPDSSTKQIELFPAAHGVPCDKVLVYYGVPEQYRAFYGQPMVDQQYGTESNKKVDVYLRFKNEEAAGLGMPLPAGRIRVSKLDPADGSLEFIGEDVIGHTPKNEQVLIKLGSAFDVVGERLQTDFKADYDRRWMEETVQIKLRNHKAEDVQVIVKENLYRWTNWEIIKPSTQFEKFDSRTIHFPVTVEKDGEATVTYTVRYTW